MKKVFSLVIVLFVTVFLFGLVAEAKSVPLKIKQVLMKTIVTEENAPVLMGKVNAKSGFTREESGCFKRYMIRAEIDAGLAATDEKPIYIGKTIAQIIEEGKKFELEEKAKKKD